MIALFGFLGLVFLLIAIPMIVGFLGGLSMVAIRYPRARWVVLPLIGLFIFMLAGGCHHTDSAPEPPLDHSSDHLYDNIVPSHYRNQEAE